MKHIARFDVRAELLTQALALPDGSLIENISRSTSRADVFTLVVTHPDLPEVEEGSQIPEAYPLLHADYEKRPAMWITFDWKLPSLKNE
jgi:hypothetical protein